MTDPSAPAPDLLDEGVDEGVLEELPQDQLAFDVDDFPGGRTSAIEAVLMVVDEPVTELALASALEIPVPDVEAAFERARSHGARVLQEPIEFEYGERECTLEDPAGHRWQLTQTIRDVAPEEWGGVTVGR